MPDEDKNFRGSLVLEFDDVRRKRCIARLFFLRFRQLSYRIDEKRKNIIFCLRLHFLNWFKFLILIWGSIKK